MKSTLPINFGGKSEGGERSGRFLILIPAYKPGREFPNLVHRLSEANLARITIVDDGSGADYRAVFDEVEKLPRVNILRHEVNRGKGAALKTGMAYTLENESGCLGILTADADGQHLVEDILRIAEQLVAQPRSLILGARHFGPEVPFRSKFGNILTRNLLKLLVGLQLTDTQTGLRAIPTFMLPRLIEIKSCRYEFELDMLLLAHRDEVPIQELPIQTVYLNGNASSHFNPLVDSARIYFVLFQSVMKSITQALLPRREREKAVA